MGLRERNAAHTRELITETALSLFTSQGYDETTMEDIAEGAEISASTLYRYFPSKDTLVIEPFAMRGQMSVELLARPAEEPLSLALGYALTAALTAPRPGTDRIRRLRAVIGATPSLQSRALEIYEGEQVTLALAIAERTGRPKDDPFCKVTSRLATTILEIVGALDPSETATDNETAARDSVEFLRGLLDQLQLEPPVLPQLAPA